MVGKYEPSFEEIKQLRDEVVLNSLFVKDYENSFGFDPKEVCDFFDGYVERLACEVYDEAKENGEKLSDDEYYERLFKKESDDNLECWYLDWQFGCGGKFTVVE